MGDGGGAISANSTSTSLSSSSGLLEAQTETRILTPKAANLVHPYVRQLLAADCLGMGWGVLLTSRVSWILYCQRQSPEEGTLVSPQQPIFPGARGQGDNKRGLRESPTLLPGSSPLQLAKKPDNQTDLESAMD